MKVRRRSFTLLEVLIALVLITIALPLLTAPYFYEALNYSQTTKAYQSQKQLQEARALLMEAVHLKKITPFNELKGEWTPLEGMSGASYKFTRLKPKEADEETDVELWEVALKLKGEPLKYKLVVKK